jgi:hypothetical protein
MVARVRGLAAFRRSHLRAPGAEGGLYDKLPVRRADPRLIKDVSARGVEAEPGGPGLSYRPSADAIFAPQGPRAALTISLPSAELAHGSSKT